MKITYRPEIDGLRAIAVGIVILNHAQIYIFGHQLFKGGFIGVDIFFVISGYLITSIILKELEITGSFSFKHFFERRIRRILPALLLIMLASLPFAWKYLLPSDLIDFSKSILYLLGFSSNYYFYFTGQEYTAINAILRPFLHTWSLSVEEQFYIFFPIILFIIFKYFKRYLMIFLILSLFASLQIADFGSRTNPSASFYFIHTRMWELLAGSILAYFEIKKGRRSKNQILNLILPIIGLLLIGNFVFFYDSKIFHPSYYTLYPIIGVCLIIWFSHKDELITKILSTKLFVSIGLISYSLYLWHYPFFAFVRVTEFFQNSLFNSLFMGIIIIFLSYLSYYFVERPARKKSNKFNIIAFFILISIFILALFNFYIIHKDGLQNRFYFSETYKLDRSSYAQEYVDFEVNYNYDNYDSRKNVLVVGNSHAENILQILSKTKFSNLIYFNLTSPQIRLDDYNFQVRFFYKFLTEKKAIIDGSYNGNFLNHLKKQYYKSDLIILSSLYSNEDLAVLNDLIKILKKDQKKIIIFDNALEQTLRAGFNRLDYYIYIHNKFPKKNIIEKIENKMFLDLKNKKNINNEIKQIAEENNVFLIERDKIFCDYDLKRCPSITEEGYKIYWDYGHITNEGSDFFAKRFNENKLFIKYLTSILQLQSN